MVNYKCDNCGFISTNKKDYNRHIKSKKHLEKVQEDTDTYLSHTYHIPQTYLDKNSRMCPFCEGMYSNSSSLARHKKVCDAKKELLEQNEIEKLKSDFERLQKEALEEKQKMQKQIESYEKLLSSAIGPKTITNYNYIQMNYPNAPVLKGKKSYGNLLETNNMKLVDLIILYYEQNRLVTFIGDYLIKEYLHKEPEKQSIWTTDLARLTYIISQAHKKGSEWSYDKKGSKTKKIIIQPVVEYIRNELAKYNEKNCNSDKASVLRKMMTINNILPEIDGNILAEKINKYISPKFIVSQGDSDMIIID